MRGRSRANSTSSSTNSTKLLDSKNGLDPEISTIICDFREQMQTVVPAYKTGKFKKIMNEILNNPYVKDSIRPKQNPKKRVLTAAKSSRSTKEDEIFNVEDADDPFTYESQTQDQLKSNKIDLKKPEKKPEKVFSLKPLQKKKSSVGSIKPLRVDPESRLSKRNAAEIRRERYTRAMRESSVSSCDTLQEVTSSARSHLSSRKLVPLSQDMLSQNTTLDKSQPETPPKERAKAKRLRQFRKSIEKETKSKEPVPEKNPTPKEPTFQKPAVIEETEKENKTNQDIDEISSQQVRQSIKNRKEKRRNRRKERDLSSDEGDDIALPRSKRILKPKSPTTQSSIASTLASTTTQSTQLETRNIINELKTPAQKTILADANTPKNNEGLANTVTPSRSILKMPKDFTMNPPTEKTPSRISFGVNQVKEIKIPSTGSSTDTSPSQSQVFRPTTPTQYVPPPSGELKKSVESEAAGLVHQTQSSTTVYYNTQIPSIPSTQQTQSTIGSEKSPLIAANRKAPTSEPPTKEPSTATQTANKFLQALDGDIFSAEKNAHQNIYKSVINSDPSQVSNGQSTSDRSSGLSSMQPVSTVKDVGKSLGDSSAESRKRKRSEENDDDVEFPVTKKAFFESMATMQKSIIDTIQTMMISTIQGRAQNEQLIR